jgi:hypothetical protein
LTGNLRELAEDSRFRRNDIPHSTSHIPHPTFHPQDESRPFPVFNMLLLLFARNRQHFWRHVFCNC